MTTVDDYVHSLPDDRRAAIAKVRDVINASLPAGYEEKLQYGMISWCVPESVLPAKDVYNKQPLALASLGSQKSHMAVYLMSVYGDEALRTWFEQAYKQSGKKLDMGKACVRFKSLDALPLDVIGEAVSKVPVDKYVEVYRNAQAATKTAQTKPASKPAAKFAAKLAGKAAGKPAATTPAAAQPSAAAANLASRRAAGKAAADAAARSASNGAATIASKPRSKTASKPAAKTANKPAAKKSAKPKPTTRR
ncbi:MAG TPA: DUF1801 domain-containing protein [Kofleriaceae bacterium]